MSHEFIGSGWAFPLRTDVTGGIALVSDDREIEESIRLIIGTAYGERPMRPEFGCAIHDEVFAPADGETGTRIAAAVRASLVRWEPRIELQDVVVSPDPDDATVLYIDITYAVGTANDPRNLVFPFYVIPAEDSAASQNAAGAN
jgi:phage baseplate assembly protein W